MAIPLEKLIDLEDERYKNAVASIKLVNEIAKTEEFNDIKKGGKKLASVALEKILTGEVEFSDNKFE